MALSVPADSTGSIGRSAQCGNCVRQKPAHEGDVGLDLVSVHFLRRHQSVRTTLPVFCSVSTYLVASSTSSNG